jgi:hypothetical protein
LGGESTIGDDGGGGHLSLVIEWGRV